MKSQIRHLTFIVTSILFSFNCMGQTDSVKQHSSFYTEPELLIGSILPNNQYYPSFGPKETVSLGLGLSNLTNKPWANYYNHPDEGILIAFSYLGNQHAFGDELDIVPYVTFNRGNRLKKRWSYKLGLGASYFTTHYDTNTNPGNVAIGTSFTWCFKAFIYKTISVNKNFNLRIGGGYCHSSDGHMVLPNYGLNSAVVGISAQLNSSPINPDVVFPKKSTDSIPKTYFAMLRTGVGLHARGNPSGPWGGPTYVVYSAAVSGGIVFKNHIKVRTGFTYRDYTTDFMDYIPVHYTTWETSNIYFFVGCEFLMGHVGLDVEEGINLYKPFYHRFYADAEGPTGTLTYYLKSAFPQRLGLNYYLIETYKNPRFNVFIGADINANFGQADFSELNIGYSIRL